MLDAKIRPLIDPALAATGRRIAAFGVRADSVTLCGFFLGLLSALSIVTGAFTLALLLFLGGRIADGLDGAVARVNGKTDRGGFLDIALDMVVYGAIPLAFAIHDPGSNALPAAVLLASFLANGSAFLAFALMAERRKAELPVPADKSIYYMAGLAEGTETVVVLAAFCIWPDAFAVIAYGFAALCFASAAGRIVFAWRILA